jgi:hypothetical protein
MPKHCNDELPSLDTADLSRVSGGAGMDAMSMLPMILMLRGKKGAAPQQVAAAPPPAPPRPRVIVDGVEKSMTSTGSGGLSFSNDSGGDPGAIA